MKSRRARWRRVKSQLMTVLAVACVVIALVPLVSILVTTVSKGWPALTSPGFFTENPSPIPCNPATNAACQYGGIQNAIVGTLVVVGLAALIALPAGVLAGIYMSEYGGRRSADALRFVVEVMTGIPSIVVGIFIVAIFILGAQAGWFSPLLEESALAGALALSVLMLPIIARTTDEALRLVPNTVREAALALGISRSKTVTRVVLTTGRSAVLTGMLLGIARAAGETAPLIVAMGFSEFAFSGLTSPAAALPTVIYYYGFSEANYPSYQALGWGAAAVLIGLMLAISVGARLLFWSRARKLGMDIV